MGLPNANTANFPRLPTSIVSTKIDLAFSGFFYLFSKTISLIKYSLCRNSTARSFLSIPLIILNEAAGWAGAHNLSHVDIIECCEL